MVKLEILGWLFIVFGLFFALIPFIAGFTGFFSLPLNLKPITSQKIFSDPFIISTATVLLLIGLAIRHFSKGKKQR